MKCELNAMAWLIDYFISLEVVLVLRWKNIFIILSWTHLNKTELPAQ